MRQILYFTLGFVISFAYGLQYAHADYDYSLVHQLGDYCPTNSSDPNVIAANADIVANTYYRSSNTGNTSATYNIYKTVCSAPAGYTAVGTISKTAYTITIFNMRTGLGTADNPFVYNRFFCIKFNTGYVPTSNPGDCNSQSSDSDSDGIPDDCDIYPNDATPYKVSVTGFQTDTNTYFGTKTYKQMITDRGTTYDLGTKIIDKHLYLQVSPEWEDPPTDCGTTLPNTETPDTDNDIRQPVINQDPSDGTPDSTNDDPRLEPGEKSDGTETDNKALQDIKSNTGKTATGIDALGDLLKDINKGIQNMTRNSVAGTGTGSKLTGDGQIVADKIDEKAAEDDADATGEKNTFAGMTDPHTYSGELVEGTDYNNVQDGDLNNETWLSDFINDNPIKNWIDSSGFDYSSAVCSLSFTHPRFGNLSFSLCEFESTFIMAGNLLFGLCGLYGLLTIIKG